MVGCCIELKQNSICFKEREVSGIFAKHGLRLDVAVTKCQVGCYKDFPIIKPSSWVKLLDEKNYLHHLFGLGEGCQTLKAAGPKLLDFWQKYKLCHGTHGIYEVASEEMLQRCVPIYIHGDEGTTYKRDGALVLSVYSPMGQGVNSKRTGQGDAASSCLEMHFAGHCFKTRFIAATMLKAFVLKKDIFWNVPFF